MFKCSVQEGRQNRNRLALGICFVQPRRAHQILFDVCGEVHPSAPMVTPNAWPRLGLGWIIVACAKHDHGFITSITPNDDAPSQGLTWILYHAPTNLIECVFD